MIIKIMNNDKLRKKVSNYAYRDLYKNWDNEIRDVYHKYLKLIEEKKDTSN